MSAGGMAHSKRSKKVDFSFPPRPPCNDMLKTYNASKLNLLGLLRYAFPHAVDTACFKFRTVLFVALSQLDKS